MATAAQIAAIHTIARRAGLDEEARRAVIQRETGKRSSRDLSELEAGRVIEALKVFSNTSRMAVDERPSAPPRPLAKGAVPLDGPYAGKLRALWLTAWNLGVVRDRTDRALLAFLERQTKTSHPRWLKDPALASAAIEGLKGWIARESGIRWPARSADAADVQAVVITAQVAMLVGLGGDATGLPVEAKDAMVELGRRIRSAKGAGR